jgi:hypothetical protein
MGQPSTRRPLWIVLAAFLAADVAFWFFLDQDPLSLSQSMLWGILMTSQITLVAIWVGLCTSLFALRFLMGVAALSVHAWMSRDPRSYFIFMGAQMLATAGPLSVARWAGLRVLPPGEFLDGPRELRPHQFRLRNLMTGITGVCLLLGVLRAMPRYAPFGADYDAEWFVGVMISSIGFALIGLVSLWAVLGTGMLALRIGAPIATATLVGMGHSWMFSRQEALHMVRWEVLMMLFVVAPLAVFRYCGYRLEWRCGETRSIDAEDAAVDTVNGATLR